MSRLANIDRGRLLPARLFVAGLLPEFEREFQPTARSYLGPDSRLQPSYPRSPGPCMTPPPLTLADLAAGLDDLGDRDYAPGVAP